MILFLLPLLFSPFGLAASWLPTLYLAVWPILAQTVSRETLVTHAFVLILFILTCDFTRQTMLKLIGFDLISFPVGIVLLVTLASDKGSLFLSITTPLFSALLTIVEPIFLMIEIYLAMDLIKRFNRWISAQANIRDEDSHDLASWEPPLARSSLFARIAVIMITVLSYVGVYLIIQEAKSLLGSGDEVPANFNHAIAALVTLQLIAFSATIYKEEGVLSGSALVCLLSAIPILIAAWSYHHLKEVSDKNSSSWSGWLWPFSILAGSSQGREFAGAPAWPEEANMEADPLQGLLNLPPSGSPHFAASNFQAGAPTMPGGAGLDFWLLEESLNRLDPTGHGIARQLLVAALRPLIMVINSLLGLSLAKLANSYFGPEICYTLAGRLLCIGFLTLLCGKKANNSGDADAPSRPNGERSPWAGGKLARLLPFSKWTLIKLLLVLAYTQMLIQQMDNRSHLAGRANLLAELQQESQQDQGSAVGGCCGAAQQGNEPASAERPLAAWFSCMWASARACSGLHSTGGRPEAGSRAARLVGAAREWLWSGLGGLLAALGWLYGRLASLDLALVALRHVWLARWRSAIVQRLAQSMVVQVAYLGQLLLLPSLSDGDAD